MAHYSTIRDLILFTERKLRAAKLFYGHGTNNARDEAAYLVLSGLKLSPYQNRELLTKKINLKQKAVICNLIRRRIKERKPVAYLTHQAWFMGLAFYVDERVLIPRSPCAELIQDQFAPWIDPRKVKRILDIGTGSGCIAIACAYVFPQAKIDATDIEAKALAVTKLNIKKHGVEKRVKAFISDVFSNNKNKKYDVIISNPPYVMQKEFKTLPQEYHHEPHSALAAGITGLNVVKRIIDEAEKYLTKNGILIIEVGNAITSLLKYYPQLPFVWLQFFSGTSEIFLLTREQLVKYK